MGDATVKPSTGDDLVLSNDDGSAKIEVNEDGTIITTGLNQIQPSSGQALVLKEDGGTTILSITTGGDVMIDDSAELFVKGTGTTASRLTLENSGGHGKATILNNSGTETIVLTGSDGKVTCSSVDTGQGANELYEMDQDVKTTSSPTFAGGTMSSIKIESTATHATSTTTSAFTVSQGKYGVFVDRISDSATTGFGVFSCNFTVASDGTVTRSDETGTSGTMYFSSSSNTINVIITNTNYIGTIKILKFGDK